MKETLDIGAVLVKQLTGHGRASPHGKTTACNSVLCTSADVEVLGRSDRVHQKPNRALKGHKAKFRGQGTQGSKNIRVGADTRNLNCR